MSKEQIQNKPIFPRRTLGHPVNELIEVYLQRRGYFWGYPYGVETIRKLGKWELEKLVWHFINWCQRHGFEMTYKK